MLLHPAVMLYSHSVGDLVVRRQSRQRQTRRSPPAFLGRIIPVTYMLELELLPCLPPVVLGSLLRLVGLMSVFCDWVRQTS